MGIWQTVGRQKFCSDNDILHWHVCGDVSGDELTTVFEHGFRIQNVHGYTLLCVCITGEWSFPAEARQALAQFHRTHKAVGTTAIVGISANKALFLDLVLRGVAKVSGRRPQTRFFGTLPEAMVWLGEQRVQFRESLQALK